MCDALRQPHDKVYHFSTAIQPECTILRAQITHNLYMTCITSVANCSHTPNPHIPNSNIRISSIWWCEAEEMAGASNFEREYSEISADITAKIGRIPHLFGKEKNDLV